MLSLKTSWIIKTKTRYLNKKKQFSRYFLSFQRRCFSVMKWIRHVVVSTQWFLRPCILFLVLKLKKHYKEGPAVFMFLEPSWFTSHPDLWPVLTRFVLLLLLPLHFLQPVASRQHRQPIPFLFLVPDNQNIISIVFSKALFMPPLHDTRGEKHGNYC